MPGPCPCGTRIKLTQKEVAYVTQDILDTVTSMGGLQIVALLDPLYGRAINLHELCNTPAPPPDPPAIEWFTDPITALDQILAAVLRISWNLWCECIPCPPIAGCTGGNSFGLTPASGYCHDYDSSPPTPHCVQQEYLLVGSQTVYVKRDSDGHCFGPFSGLAVDWIVDPVFDPNLPVHLESYGGGGATGWNTTTGGTNMTVYVGAGDGGGPHWVWDPNTVTADQPPTPAACDPTTICTAVDYIRERVNVLDRMLVSVMAANNIEVANGTITIPGQPAPITGPITQWLVPAIQSLMPITPAELSDATTTPVTASGAMDVTGRAFVEVLITAAPPSLGQRGVEAPVYYQTGVAMGPGWLLLVGDYGVISYHPLVYPQGAQIILPPTATTLLLELGVGVEVSVTTFARSLS